MATFQQRGNKEVHNMYEIIRTEITPNREGINETFLQMQITDDLGIYPFAKWLTPAEKQAVDTFARTIDDVAGDYLAQARQCQIDNIAAIKNMELEV